MRKRSLARSSALGLNRINHHCVVQKKIDDPPLGLLNGRPKLYLFAFASSSQRLNSLRPGTLLYRHLGYFLALGVADPYLVKRSAQSTPK